MRNPVDCAHLFTYIENGRFVEHWDDLNLHEAGAIPMQGGATR